MIDKVRQCRIVCSCIPLPKTEIFQRYAASIWSEGERLEFAEWIAENPLAGDVIPGVRWLPKSEMAPQRDGQAWRCAGDLLQRGGWPNLAADCLRKSQI